ncbi:SH3 domain-containing protein [Aureispira anguillae]|uniref:SH3 domain-containing protein n=1 Tax=Aureispira anguillae TaxID=2864201 RepID=A0A915YCX0_9BACT|nr:SH3 domain-containing protein [Aureispira anguillae]BDS10769.1 SH3 domain-containing protein [Aureispira anguillae]
MKTRTLFLFILWIPVLLLGQEEAIDYAEGRDTYHQFENGQVAYLLADRVNIRDKASTEGAIIANLGIGTAVTIVRRSSYLLRLNGFETNWYKVLFEDQGIEKKGYVWGGLIAEGRVQSTKDKTIHFLYGIASYKKQSNETYPKYRLKLQVRACRANQELAKLEFETSGFLEIFHGFGNYGDRGLKKIQDVLEFNESQERCAGFNGNTVIFWDGNVLHKVVTLYPGSDVPYYATDDLIFPADKGGVAGQIIRDQQEGWYDIDKEKDIVESHKKVAYIWTGSSLKQTKVLADKSTD